MEDLKFDEYKPFLKAKYSKFHYPFLFGTVFVSTFLLLFANNAIDLLMSHEQKKPDWYEEHFTTDSSAFFTINTEGCTIPGMKPMDASIRDYIFKPHIQPCPNANRSLIGKNRTHIWINRSNAKYYHVNITYEKDFKCCYKKFYRPNETDVWSPGVDDQIKYEECVHFTDAVEVNTEFIRAQCKFRYHIVYDQLFLFAPKQGTFDFHGSKEMTRNMSKSLYNVLIIGIDSVSRLNFHRTMPKTLAFLKDRGAVELMGYNKIGSNSFPNIMAILTGYKAMELERICRPYDHSVFDFCPFVWHWYRKAGYHTALAEDTAWLGTWNYLADGFIRPPVDYYMHPFIKEAERSFQSYMCVKDKFAFQVLLDYIEDISVTLKDTRLFGFFWEVTMTHNNLNYPVAMDDSYERLLTRMENSKYLDESIIFLISDHGIRWGDIRMTKQGGYEESLPFVYILTPESFQDQYKVAFDNLKLNSRRFTTPLDFHETLNDLIDLKNINNAMIKQRTEQSYSLKRSMSWFLPVPTNRTCKMAEVDETWCTCREGNKINKNSRDAKAAAKSLVIALNSILKDEKQCVKLSLDKIVDAMEMRPHKGNRDIKNSNSEINREFIVAVLVKPSEGVFEGTMKYEGRSWKLSGTPSRLNLYGNQSHCVHTPHLKLYCFCKD